MPEQPESPFRPEHFRRDDERPDAVFYAEPRLVVHIDQFAIKAIGEVPLGGAALGRGDTGPDEQLAVASP